MVAIIKSSASLRNVLHYNENKARQKVAELIHSMNFVKDTEQLGFTDKIRTLEKLISLNERTKLKAVHISLNFDPTEKFAKETLSQIADTYMRQIGFGDQPYLVYQHNDAGHPHIHIVSTNIQRNGKRIAMQNIGRNQSETARKAIEKDFRLVQAEKSDLKMKYELKPLNVQKLQYGKSETRMAMTNVIYQILPSYKYASLPELNAVLRNYNIVADRGSENSRTYKSNGLVYRVLDERGQKVGSPVKASAIYNKPTLKFLNEKFIQNQADRQKHKLRIRNTVDLSLIRNPKQSLDQLIKSIRQEGIQVVLRQNQQGIIYGLTYIDHQTKCVFNGNDLGKQYSANQMQERCGQKQTLPSIPVLKQELGLNQFPTQSEQKKIISSNNVISKIMEKLVQEELEETLSSELREEQRRRKRKKLRH
jgi:hypothetical protein